MRMTGQYIRGRGAARWTREEQIERERLLAGVAGARVQIAEIRDRAAQRAADEREDREERIRSERRQDEFRSRLRQITGQ